MISLSDGKSGECVPYHYYRPFKSGVSGDRAHNVLDKGFIILNIIWALFLFYPSLVVAPYIRQIIFLPELLFKKGTDSATKIDLI